MSTSKKTPAEQRREQLMQEAKIRAMEERNQLASEKLRQAQLQNNTAQEGFFRPDMNSFRYAQKDNQGGFQQAVDFGVPSNIRRVQDELEDTSQYGSRSYTPIDGMEDLDSNKFLGLYGDVVSRMNSLGTRAAQAGYDINNLDISDPAQAQLFKEFNTLKNFGNELGTRLQNSRRIREEELKKGNINRSSDGGRGMQTADMYFSGNKWKERSNRINGDAKALFERGAANDANKLIENYRNELRSELSNAESIGDDVLAQTLRQEIASIQDVYYDPSKVNELAHKKNKDRLDNMEKVPDVPERVWKIINNRDWGDLNQYYNITRSGDKWKVIPKKDVEMINPSLFQEGVEITNDQNGMATVLELMKNAKMTSIKNPSATAEQLNVYNPKEGEFGFDIKQDSASGYVNPNNELDSKKLSSMIKFMNKINGSFMKGDEKVTVEEELGSDVWGSPVVVVNGSNVDPEDFIQQYLNTNLSELEYSGDASGSEKIMRMYNEIYDSKGNVKDGMGEMDDVFSFLFRKRDSMHSKSNATKNKGELATIDKRSGEVTEQQYGQLTPEQIAENNKNTSNIGRVR